MEKTENVEQYIAVKKLAYKMANEWYFYDDSKKKEFISKQDCLKSKNMLKIFLATLDMPDDKEYIFNYKNCKDFDWLLEQTKNNNETHWCKVLEIEKYGLDKLIEAGILNPPKDLRRDLETFTHLL